MTIEINRRTLDPPLPLLVGRCQATGASPSKPKKLLSLCQRVLRNMIGMRILPQFWSPLILPFQKAMRLWGKSHLIKVPSLANCPLRWDNPAVKLVVHLCCKKQLRKLEKVSKMFLGAATTTFLANQGRKGRGQSSWQLMRRSRRNLWSSHRIKGSVASRLARCKSA